MGVFTLSLLGAASLLNAAVATPVQAGNITCCDAISAVLPGKVVHAVNANDQSKFNLIKSSYWSLREVEISPACFITPTSAEDVSAAIKVLNQPQHMGVKSCKFAVRSGGHTTWPAANIRDGVTIDLSKMKQFTVSKDEKMVSLGPGNRWGEVYSQLEPLNIGILGGRWGNVGVGGLLTGGGLSFFQGRGGLACDGVINHEVVLSDGSIVQANAKVNPDLHKALKGGNNNFGIVTRFDVNAFPQGPIWGGSIMHFAKEPTTMKWFETLSNSSVTDLSAMTMYTVNPIPFTGQWASGGFVTYSKNETTPKIFRGLYDTSTGSTAKLTTFNAVAQQNARTTAFGGRATWASFSYINSAAFMRKLIDLAPQESKKMPKWSSGIQLIFQPLWKAPRARVFAETGGNSLGLEDDGDLIIVLVMASGAQAADDNGINEGLKSYIDKAAQMAKEDGVYSSYVYLNYAAEFQDPIAGYGEKSKAELIKTSEKYDPIQLFQKQVPGGFKLKRTDRDWLST